MTSISFVLPMKKCGTENGGLQSTPESTLQLVFEAAANEKLGILSGLCDPLNENDGDTRDICNAASGNPDEFIEFFAKGKIRGETQYEGNLAAVPFWFGPEGKQTETMNLVKRGDKWYLSSF